MGSSNEILRMRIFGIPSRDHLLVCGQYLNVILRIMTSLVCEVSR